MQKTDKLVTIIIGERSNLSSSLANRCIHSEVFSSSALLQSLGQLSKFKKNKINVIFNNFQPSNQLSSFLDPSKYIELSISLTIKVLMYLIENEVKINQVIYTSSCSVYGNSISTDDYPEVSPIGIAPSLKYLNEQFLREICINNNLNLIITRIFNMFGGNDNFSVISKIINCYKNKIHLKVNNDGKSVRDFIHVSNVVDIYEKLLEEPRSKFETIDIGSGQGKSVSDILNYLSNNGYIVDTITSHSNEIDFSQADISKIQKIIDVSSFLDVNLFLLNEFKQLDGKNNY
jgi:nucleoside-diphosphate-sugar epimerase